MSKLLFGKEVADKLDEATRQGASALAQLGVEPTLAIVRVGDRPDDLSYERTAVRRAESLGIQVRLFTLPESARQEELLEVIDRVNQDAGIHGCLMFKPLPKGIDEKAVCDALTPHKDIDGISAGSLAAIFADTGEGFAPATAQACLEMLDFNGISLAGKRVCVLGRSLVIGKPVAMMALARNATVTICHSKTPDLAAATRDADVVICATGRPRAYGAEYFRAGQVILDVGINFDEAGTLCGDVDFEAVEGVVDAITPVPRGLGSVTTSVTLSHVVQAAAKACGTTL